MENYKNQIDQELFERIEAYLLQRMSAEDRAGFEEEMKHDEKLRNEVRLQQRLIAAAETLSHEDGSWIKKSLAPVKSMGNKKVMLWYAAAAIVLVLAGAWFYRTRSLSAESVYARYFVPDSGLPVVMSGNDNNYDFYDGMISYKEEDYHRAIEIWAEVYKKNDANDTLQYYMGLAFLNDRNPEAVSYLQRVAQNQESVWQDRAIWYLTLACLKFDRISEAKKWVDKITDKQQAELLKKDIEKLPY